MIQKVFYKVFKKPKYVIASVLIFVVLFFGSILYPNFSLVSEVWSRGNIGQSLTFIWRLILSVDMSQSLTSIVLMFLISALFALNISLLIYYLALTKSRVSKTDLGKSSFGLVLGIIGVGCASCGSLFVLSLLTFLGVGGILSALPLHGEEFGIIGVLLLLYSNYSVMKKINDPLVC